MQAVLESREIRDIARQMQMNVSANHVNEVEKENVRDRGIITSYEISKITGEANCKVSDKIRRLVPRGREYYYDTIFTNESNCQYRAIALTEKGLDIFIKGVEGRGNRNTQKQIEDIKKIRAAVGIVSVKVQAQPEQIKESKTDKANKADKIREAVDNLVLAESFITVVEDRFIGRDYENLTYQQRDDFERLFYFMADQLHNRIKALKTVVDGN